MGANLALVPDPHWCWFETPAGGLAARDDLLRIQRSNPRAVANALLGMKRVMEGGTRDGASKPLRDGIREVKVRDGSVHVRVLYFVDHPHWVAAKAVVKKRRNVDPDDIEAVAKIKRSWTKAQCSGVLAIPIELPRK